MTCRPFSAHRGLLVIGLATALLYVAASGRTSADDGADRAAPTPADVEFFEQHVRPILAENCWKCHGPDRQRGHLRLDHRSFILRGGELGPAVSLEDPADSNLLRAINYEDLQMPPDGQLKPDQIAILSDWIHRGLPWTPGPPPAEAVEEPAEAPAAAAGDHWAYRPLAPTAPPKVDDRAWSANPIDRFVLAGLERQSLRPNPPADPPTLVRRLHFDLLGLPPTWDEVEAFTASVTQHPAAYEMYVDRLLSRPELGEKWGRHWLDLVRFAETNGYERDGPKPNAWRYRDYVIAALNSDKPYDRFVLEQLAGDELPDRNSESIIATGYYRLGLWDDEPADADQAYYDSLDDVVSTTSLTFLATTVGCARCHDHKIDPIPQRDYYRMLAFFHNTYNDIQQTEFKRTPFTLNTQVEIATADELHLHRQQQESRDAQRDALEQQVQQYEARVVERFTRPEQEDARDERVRRHMIAERIAQVLAPQELAIYQDARRKLRELRRRRPPVPQALAIRENGRTASDTFVLVRGNAHAQGELVEPGFLSVLTDEEPVIPELPPEINSSGRRLAFARWLVDPNNPLTARVIVNRVWQHHFGRGLVRTSSDFGQYGDAPTHPELLDYLAAELIRHDWQLKWLHRVILTSQTYRLASSDSAEGLAADPENNRFWRFDPRRLTAEEYRDSVLWISGLLNPEMGGASVYAKIPDEILQTASRPDAAWGTSSPSDQVRRSVYVLVKRSISDPVLLAFDSADTDASCPVRFVTTVPTQALTTLNGEFFNEQAGYFAQRLRREVGNDSAAQVERALRLALSRPPSDVEIERGLALLDGWQSQDGASPDEALRYFCLLVLNLNELLYID